MAERQGFEPWIRLPVYYLSKVARSTTLPPLQWHDFTTSYYSLSRCRSFNKRHHSNFFIDPKSMSRKTTYIGDIRYRKSPFIIKHYPAIFLNKLPTVSSTFVLGINFVINAVLLLPFPGIINCLSFTNPSRHSTATS